jgi:hypothetical protein
MLKLMLSGMIESKVDGVMEVEVLEGEIMLVVEVWVEATVAVIWVGVGMVVGSFHLLPLVMVAESYLLEVTMFLIVSMKWQE